MTSFPQPLLDHLAGEATTICHCWRLTRADGMVLGFTDHDESLTVAGTLFRPESGLSGSEAKASLGLAVDTSDVEGVLSADVITDADIDDGLYAGAAVETLMVNWRSPTDFALLRRASIGRIERRDGRFVAELESLATALDRPNGRTIRRTCDAELGDARCGVELGGSPFAGAGTVISVLANERVVVSGLSGFAAGWFANGVLTWITGDHTGRTARIIADEQSPEGTVLSFWSPIKGVAAGDIFGIAAGCDKQFRTCRDKFGNALNFRGFPHLPGNDAAYGYASGDQVFDGGALVP